MSADTQLNLTELLNQARQADATDIHIVAKVDGGSRIFFRINNQLEPFKECAFEECFALWKSIHEGQDGEFDANFDPLQAKSLVCEIRNQALLPEEFMGVKFINVHTPEALGQGFTLVLRLFYKLPDEGLDLKSTGYSKGQLIALSEVGNNPRKNIVIEGAIRYKS